MNSSAVNRPLSPISRNCTPAFAAEQPVSCHTAWLFALLLVLGFIALYNMSDGFRRGIDEQWHKQQLVVSVPAFAR